MIAAYCDDGTELDGELVDPLMLVPTSSAANLTSVVTADKSANGGYIRLLGHDAPPGGCEFTPEAVGMFRYAPKRWLLAAL